MTRNRTQTLILSGLLVAVGVLLPYFTSHMFGIPGTVLLPMHIPVFLIGLLCGPMFGAIGGLLTPLLSSMLTGMPAAFPMLPIMAGELMVYGLMSGLLRHKAKWPALFSLLVAMVCGRAMYGLVFAVLFTANGGVLRAASVSTAIVTGLPGIVIQLAVIPLIIKAVEHHKGKAVSLPAEKQIDKQWIGLLQKNAVSCIIVQNGEIVHTADGRGVKPIMHVLETEPALLSGAVVIDKIIGKAAAMLLHKGGASYVYGETMSVAGYAYLQAKGIHAEFGRCIDVISNREGNGICPLERSVLKIDDPEEAYIALKNTIRSLMSA